MSNYTTVTDARDALTNSGVIEWFGDDTDLNAVAEYMYRNDATPEQAVAEFVGGLDNADRRALGLA